MIQIAYVKPRTKRKVAVHLGRVIQINGSIEIALLIIEM